MKLQILGTGCAKCKALTQNVQTAVQQLGLDATVEKVEDIQTIMKYGVMSTPALVIDGKVAMQGKVPSPDEIKRALQEVR